MIANTISADGSILTVTSAKYGVFDIRIDPEDADRVSRRQWSVMKKKGRTQVYFGTRAKQSDGNKSTVQLHRFITNTPDELQVDHIHHDYFDLRKSELRTVTNRQNGQNRKKQWTFDGMPTSSRLKGVFREKRTGSWYAKIRCDGRLIHLGTFPSTNAGELDAARVYDRAALKHHGEYAKINFPLSDYRHARKQIPAWVTAWRRLNAAA